jgi:hypothetical protein
LSAFGKTLHDLSSANFGTPDRQPAETEFELGAKVIAELRGVGGWDNGRTLIHSQFVFFHNVINAFVIRERHRKPHFAGLARSLFSVRYAIAFSGVANSSGNCTEPRLVGVGNSDGWPFV